MNFMNFHSITINYQSITMNYQSITIMSQIFFHILGMSCHPNWRSHTFQRGRSTTNQIGISWRDGEAPRPCADVEHGAGANDKLGCVFFLMWDFMFFFIFTELCYIYIYIRIYIYIGYGKNVRHYIKLATWYNHCELLQTSINNPGRSLKFIISLTTIASWFIWPQIYPKKWWLNQLNPY